MRAKLMKKYAPIFMMLFCFHLTYGQTKFDHILITNDDGIEDADRLLALAKSVKNVTDRVSIIVSAFDRSGTSNHTAHGKYQSTLEVTCKYFDEDNNISAYTMPANPADCVLLGLGGFFSNDRPDLVLSGINSGPNIGPDWFGSGTIGAARMSAYLGVKAVAFSGFDDDKDESFSVIPRWIKAFISSGLLDEMEKNSYLTVGFPSIPFEDIKGARVAERKTSFDEPKLLRFKQIYGGEPQVPENTTMWVSGDVESPNHQEIKNDEFYLQQGFIVITPMTIDENNNRLLQKMKEGSDLIPPFSIQ